MLTYISDRQTDRRTIGHFASGHIRLVSAPFVVYVYVHRVRRRSDRRHNNMHFILKGLANVEAANRKFNKSFIALLNM